MKTLIQLTEVALVGESIKEIEVLLDPFEIAIIEKGTQMTSHTPLVNRPNQSMPISVITFKSGRKFGVKEDFATIVDTITKATS
jgi:hypothetical protein